MAEVIVNSLLLKLGETVLQEAIKLYGVKDKVEAVQRQLEWTQSFLKDADSKSKGSDKRIQNWVKELREVSFWIEDAIDMYLLKIEILSVKEESSFKNALKWMARKPKKLYYMDSLDCAINKIQSRLTEINDNKARFGITDLGLSNMSTVCSRNIRIDDEMDLVGFENEKKKVLELLLDERTCRRYVVSIIGIGGLGKTALAEKVYQSVREEFQFHIWLTVSQVFKRIDLLKKVLDKANISGSDDEEHCIMEVKKFLREKRYLIILDDVYSEDLWEQMMIALPDNPTSRVLMTTRKAQIAMAADIDVGCVCELSFLPSQESIRLLFQKALPQENYIEGTYPPDLLEVAKKVVDQCGGLPLALVIVGGLLSRKGQTQGAWNMVMKTMDWRTVGLWSEIIASSYEDLPVYLRSCFMYFASFPEDHEYKAEFLTWLWIAEGFIPHDTPGAMEQIAQNYLDELAQRCMIHVLKRSLDGSVLIFRVHDLIREFAIQEAKEKDFLMVLRKQDDMKCNNRIVRRVTSQLKDSSWDECSSSKKSRDEISSEEKKITESTNPNIRTLFLFGNVVPFSSQFKLLRVLVIFHYNGRHGDPFPDLLVGTLKKLLQLRCLAFIGCNFPSEVVLPINHLHKLITLVIRSCQDVIVPPRSLWGIKTLRHVLVDRAYNLCDTLEGVLEPVNVPNLQTLEEVKINKPGIELLNMPAVLKLHLINESDSWKPIVILLLKLVKLESLTLQSMEIPLEIIDTTNYASYQVLQTLCLRGRWHLEEGALSVQMFPPFLSILTLASSHLDENSILVLEKLPCLKILVLEMAYAGQTMTCSNGGFCQLQQLTLAMLQIRELEIEEGAMPRLNHLEIHSCDRLRMVPDLQHVKTLKVLALRSMKEEFKSLVKNDDNKRKIKTIRSINFYE